MSGHSKWSTIKRKKGAVDAKRGQIFTKIAREIIMAAKSGGGDPVANSRLRFAIMKAKSVNMPSDNVKRAIDRAIGGTDESQIEELTYEAYLYGGVAMIIECMTDNKNRTLPEIKSILTKAGCALAEKGAVSYLFHKRGLLVFGGEYSEDQVMEIALNHEAEDIVAHHDGTVEVIVPVDHYEKLKEDFEGNKMVYLSAEITMLPTSTVPVEDLEVAQKIMALTEKLENHEDVQNVYQNADISQEILERLEE